MKGNAAGMPREWSSPETMHGAEVRVMAGEPQTDYRFLLRAETRAALEEREAMLQARKRELLEAIRGDMDGG